MIEINTSVRWRTTPRSYHYGYEDGAERYGSALTEIRKELGFETTDEFSQWLYESSIDRFGNSHVNVETVLLDAAEFPALGWDSLMYVVENVAKALGVSPGTLVDELWLRASLYSESGVPDED